MRLPRQRKRKRPKLAQSPQPAKRPKAAGPTIHGGPLAWRFSECDRGGAWAWTKLSDPSRYKNVMEKLQEFEKKNWDEITRSGSHPIAVSRIEKQAQNRLRKIHKDDVDELMSFRLTGTRRDWCVRQLSVMKVLWWDPNHEICPAPRRRT